jgi:hypothetical protein
MDSDFSDLFDLLDFHYIRFPPSRPDYGHVTVAIPSVTV